MNFKKLQNCCTLKHLKSCFSPYVISLAQIKSYKNFKIYAFCNFYILCSINFNEIKLIDTVVQILLMYLDFFLFYLEGRKKCENLKLWIWIFLLSLWYTTNRGSNTLYIVLTYGPEVLLRYFIFSFSEKKA